MPIVSGGDVIGALNLESDTLDAFSEADVEFLEFFAVAAAISIEKAVLHREVLEKHRIEQQLSIAKEVQMALLPAADPVLDGYDIAGINVPTWEIGGDYFDYLPQPDGRLGVAIADVSGKGVPAALHHGDVQGGAPGPARQGRRARCDRGPAQPHPARLDGLGPLRHRLLWTPRAPHRRARLRQLRAQPAAAAPCRRAARRARQRRPGPGHVGCGRRSSRAPRRSSPATSSCLYTDGVIEVMNGAGEMFGVDRLEDVIRRRPGHSSRNLVDAVIDATRAFAGRAGFEDDFTLVVIRREAGASGTAG